MSEYLKELCRTCLCSGGEMFPLFDADVKMVAAGFHTAAYIMKMFTSVPINNTDDFPDRICGVCLNEIQRAYIFKQKCEKSEKILHQMKKVQIKVRKLTNISKKNDHTFQYDVKEEPEETINDYEDLESTHIENESKLKRNRTPETIRFDNIDHTSSVLQATFKSEPELIIEDFSIRLIDCDINETDRNKEQFHCLACGKESQSLVMYLDHIVSDHIQGNLCKICNAEFNCSKFEHSAKHPPSNYSDELFHDLTSRFFNGLNHKRSSDFVEEGIREGKKCQTLINEETVCEESFKGEKFTVEELIDEEFIDHTSEKSQFLSEKPKIQCKICFKMFTRKLNLKAHMLIHSGEKSFECKLCLEKFRQQRLLRLHMEMEHINELPDIESNRLNKRSLKELLRTKHTKVPINLKSKNQCGVCARTFTRNSYLRIHMRLHSGETPFQCEICTKQFRYKKLLRIHLATKHANKSKYQCYVCSKIFGYNNYLINHMRTHKSEKSFECKFCSVKFWYSPSLISHMKNKHTEELPGDETKYNCSDCSNIFSSNEELVEHMIEHTENRPMQSEKLKLPMNTATDQSNEPYSFKPIYQCGNCSKIFLNNRLLVTHMRSHSSEKPFQCELCLETFRQNSFQCHMKTRHSEELTGVKPKYQCSICSKIFGYNKDLNRHMLSHTGERPLHCEICLEKFRYKPSLAHHMTERHPNGLSLPEPTYECKICSKVCRRRNDLNSHMRMHIKEKLLKCDYCSKKFKMKGSLVCHIKFRHPEKLPKNKPKHKCNICSKIFNYSKDLIKHMRRHTGEPSFKCKLCSEKCQNNKSLVRHVRTKHAPELTEAKLKYQCNYCSEVFFYNKDLVSHKRSHKTEATLQCKFCPSKFVHKVSLLRHMRTHHREESLEPERNYQCDLCSQKFRRQDNLLKHVRRHNNKTSFPCNLCTLRFKQERSLRCHLEAKHSEALSNIAEVSM